MRVLDLFSGTGGWSDPWLACRHDVKRVELDPGLAERTGAIQHDVTDTAGLIERLGDWRPDVLLASPPCNSFSTMTMGRMWTPDGEPKHPTAVLGRAAVEATLRLIVALDPDWFIIENPRARLRTLPMLAGLTRSTVWYCRFGEQRAKPTDLWHRLPWHLHQQLDDPIFRCHNGNADHLSAPRGSSTGTQGGFTREESYRIPQVLARMVRDGIAGDEVVCTRCIELGLEHMGDRLHAEPEPGCHEPHEHHAAPGYAVPR